MGAEDFLNQVCSQIRCKKAHPKVREELEAHIEDQARAYEKKGEESEGAMARAVAEMGDPVVVGGALDCAHRPKPAWGLIVFAGFLMASGAALQTWLGINSASADPHSWLIYIPLGIAVMAAAYFVDYTILVKHPTVVYLTAVALSVAAIQLAGVSYVQDCGIAQYSAFLTIPLFAGCVYAARNRGIRGIVWCLFLLFLKLLQLAAVPSMLSCLCFGGAALVLMTFAAVKGHFGAARRKHTLFLWGFTLISLGAIAGAFLSAATGAYRWERLKAAFFPMTADPLGGGYYASSLRELVSQSSFFSVGTEPASGLAETFFQNSGYQANCLLNMAAAAKGGWSSAAVILVFAVFVLCAMYIAAKQKNVLGGLVCMSVASIFAVSGAAYILSNFGYLNFLGGILPFLSKGTAGFAVCSGLLGIFLSACKGNGYMRDKDIERGMETPVIPYRLVVRVERMEGVTSHENR